MLWTRYWNIWQLCYCSDILIDWTQCGRPRQINRMFHLLNWSMKRIHPESLKVQPAHSFHSATGVILLKRQPLTSTTMFLFKLCERRALKHHSRQTVGKKKVCAACKLTISKEEITQIVRHPPAIMLSKIVDALVFSARARQCHTSEGQRTWHRNTRLGAAPSSAANNMHSRRAPLDSRRRAPVIVPLPASICDWQRPT